MSELDKYTDKELRLELRRRVIANYDNKVKVTKDVVCEFYDTTIPEKGEKGGGKGPQRLATKAAMYILRKHFDMKVEQVGVGINRDHATVSTATKTVSGQMSVDPYYRKEIANIINLINKRL